jgi:hypothetical protein
VKERRYVTLLLGLSLKEPVNFAKIQKVLFDLATSAQTGNARLICTQALTNRKTQGEQMANTKLRGMLLAATAIAMTLVSLELSAQTPADASPVRGAQSASRAGVILYYNLNAAELRLTSRQKAQIDEIADAYIRAVKQIPPIQRGGQPTQETIQAQRAPRQNLITAISRVLNAEQRQTFEVLQQHRARPHVMDGGNFDAGTRGGTTR